MLFTTLPVYRRQKMGHKNLCPILLFMHVFILFLLAAMPAFCGLSDDLSRKGIDELRNNRYREAIVYLESALRSDPDNENIKKNLSIAYHYRGLSHSSNDEFTNAISCEEQALKNDPGNSIIKEQLAIYLNNYGLKCADSGNYGPAHENLQRALDYSPASETVKGNLYNIILRQADYFAKKKAYGKALGLAEEAIRLMPDSSPAYIFAGNLSYNQDNFKQALAYWDSALECDKDNTDIKERIEKLKREEAVEQAFKTKKKSHFRIRFDKELDPDYVSLIYELLEDARRAVRKEFNLSTSEIVPVVVYTDSQFEQATEQPYWTQGVYDGKIRLKNNDASRSEEMLRRVFFHEYAHACLYLNYGNNIPVWLHEGFAQFNEPGRPAGPDEIEFVASYIEKNGPFSLERLDGMFEQTTDSQTVKAAYLEAKIFFAYLLEAHTKYRIKRFLKELEGGSRWQEAVKGVYHRNTARLDKEFNEYLDN